MLADRRRLLIIAAIVAVLGTVAWTYFGSTATGTAVERPAGNTRTRAAASPADPLPIAEGVRLSSLEESRGEPSSTTRNPFKFQRRAATAPTAAEASPVFAPAPTAPPVPSGPPPPPPIPLKFIGVLETGGTRWAVLAAGEGRVPLHGKEGDIIDGRYRIVKLGTESIDMVYLDGRGKQTIRLTGQ